jgi:hypothetical protein
MSGAVGMAPVMECLPSKHAPLSSNGSTTKKSKKPKKPNQTKKL